MPKDNTSSWSLWISIALLAIILIVSLALFTKLPLYIPIYNKLPWGYSRLGSRIELFLPIGLVTVFVGANTIVAHYLQVKFPILSRFLFFTSLIATILVSIFTLKVIQLVL